MSNREHVISDKLLEEANLAFLKNEHWIAYNTLPYFLNGGDMYFFKTADEAHQFSVDNISDYDNYRVIQAYSTADLLRQIPYGANLENQLANPDANGLYNTDGNAFTDALIDHIEEQQSLNNKKSSIKNEKDFDSRKDASTENTLRPEQIYKQKIQKPQLLEKKRESPKKGLRM